MLQRLFSICFLLLSVGAASAQNKTRDSLPYQKYPTLPAFNLLMQDSVTIFNTYHIPEGRPTLMIFFSPDCDHCQMTIKDVLGKMDSLTGVQIMMFTPMPLSTLRPFAAGLKLKDYRNIMVAKDYEYFFPKFYGANYVPYIVVYDRKKKLVKMWEGGVKIAELMKIMTAL